MKEKAKSNKILYFIIFLGLLIILAELFLNYQGKSLCTAKSCKIAEDLLLFPKKYLLLIALSYFFLLLIVLKIYAYTSGTFFLGLFFFLLGVGLLGDGIFISRLLLEWKLPCYFCLLIFALMLVLTLSAFLVFRSTYFNSGILFALLMGGLLGEVLAFKITAQPYPNLSQSPKNFILLYAENCKRCEEILKKGDKNTFEKVPFTKVFPLFKVFDLKEVPVLIEKKAGSYEIIWDSKIIEERLFNSSQGVLNGTCGESTSEGGLCVLP